MHYYIIRYLKKYYTNFKGNSRTILLMSKALLTQDSEEKQPRLGESMLLYCVVCSSIPFQIYP